MKVSVIVPCYNSELTLQRTIDSFVAQEYSNKELIIIDGNSSDSTLEIIKKNGKYISIYISEPDHGVYDAMNKGLRLATGDIIGIISSNDWICDNAIEHMVSCFHSNPSTDIVHGNIFKQKEIGSTIYTIVRKGGNPNALPKCMTIRHPSCFVKKEMYHRFCYDTTYKIAGDYEFMLRSYIEGASFKYIDEEIIVMTDGGLSTTFNTILESFKILWSKNYKINSLRYFTKRLFLFTKSKFLRTVGKIFLSEVVFKRIEVKKWNKQFN